MKIFIAYQFKNVTWGGGNQFLRNLKKIWETKDIYVNTPQEADVILFNSHQHLADVVRLRRRHVEKIFIHRIDGPISQYRGRNMLLDKLIFLFGKELADGVVFQSQWSLEESRRLGYRDCQFQEVIYNAADPYLFYPLKKPVPECQGKAKLMATSWSGNKRKGFDIYTYLDSYLNFDKYEFTFIGNSPVTFKNIKHITPLSSEEIGRHLRENHIFISASEREACSNSIIEALCCGLPVVYRDGSSSEIVKQAGLPFSSGEEALKAIAKLRENYRHYQNAINILSVIDIADKYSSFAQRIHEEKVAGSHMPKKIDRRFLFNYKFLMFLVKTNDLFYGFFKKVEGLC